MATLEKIRSKGVLLLVVVGIALLAFIIGDFLNSGSTYFNQSREMVAEIAGEDIHINEYAASLEQIVEVYKIESGQTDFDENTHAQLRNSVWESTVTEKIISQAAAEIGMCISPNELSDHCFGNNVHPIISQRRTFYDETGQFSPSALVQFLNSLDATPENQQMADQIQQAKNYWLFWENNLKSTLLQEKYTSLISKAVTANSLEAEKNFELAKNTVDVSYAMQPYYAVADSLVEVTDAEVKSLYSNRKENYKQEPNRSIEYIAFNIVPSQEDFDQASKWINELKSEFTTTTDIAGVVNSNSDVTYDGRNFSKNSIPAYYKDFAFEGKTGDVSEITFEDNTYRMARIVENGYSVSDSVKVRHILIDNNEERADSIVKAIKRGADFGKLALAYSLVPQSAQNNGEIGWVREFDLPKELSVPAFAKRAGEVFKVSTSGQGIQIMQIMEKSKATPKVKLAIMERKVTPSTQTYGQLYNDAKQFVVENNTIEKFNEEAGKRGLVVMPAVNLVKNASQVANLSNSREIVRWVFNNKKGDVSDVFECGESFVVATIKDTKDGEYRSVNDVAYELRAELLKEKKADLIKEQIKEVLAKENTLEAVAKFAKDEVQIAEAVNFASYQFGNAGMEPYVLGSAIAIDVEKISEPLQGNAGVFVVKTTNQKASSTEFNKEAEMQQINMRIGYYLPYQIIDQLRQNAEIVDNRSVFY